MIFIMVGVFFEILSDCDIEVAIQWAKGLSVAKTGEYLIEYILRRAIFGRSH